MLRHAAEAERVLYPCHNYKHAPVIKTVRGAARERAHRQGPPGDAADLPQHARQGRHRWRTDWRRERRYSGGGIAMDHGSHTFYLAFEWLRVVPDGDHARARRRWGRSTPRTTSPAACASRPASRRRTCRGTRACARCSTRSTASAAPSASRTTTSSSRCRNARAGGRRHDLEVRARRRSPRTGWTPATSPGSTRCSTTSRAPSRAASSSASEARGGVPLRAAHRHRLRLGARGQPRAAARRAWRRSRATTSRDRMLAKGRSRVSDLYVSIAR